MTHDEIRAAIGASPELQALIPDTQALAAHPVHALIGFDGVTWDREMADAPPVPIRGIVVGSLILAVGVIGWAIGRMWRRAWA